MPQAESHRQGRLTARPGSAADGSLRPGLHKLGLSPRRDGYLYVPANRPAGSLPLVIFFHGAGADAANILPLMTGPAEERGFLVLAPDSGGRTWDVILGAYGPDVERLDQALGLVFEREPVDPARIAVAGFSDGASYALSLGLTNGDFIGDVLAFSPGFMAPLSVSGHPRIFISHGTHDNVLPIARCGRRVAADLRQAGYDVDYREFDGGHVVPADMTTAALDRFLAQAG